jgi:Fe-S cluster assembly iron-binding protein IscA
MLSNLKRRPVSIVRRVVLGNKACTTSAPIVLHRKPMLYPAIQRRTMVIVTQTKSNDLSAMQMKSEIPEIRSKSEPSLLSTMDSSNDDTTTSSSTQDDNQNDELLVTVTDACYQRIHYLISQKQQTDLYLRVFVDAGGCSGFTYQFELDNDGNINPNDDVIFTEPISDNNNNSNSDGSVKSPARVVVDKGSLKLLAGSKIDFVQEMIKSTFEVRENPLSESACGCGSSFALKNFASNPATH